MKRAGLPLGRFVRDIMPKSLIRAVVFILVPALMAEPAKAFALYGTRCPEMRPVSLERREGLSLQNRFEQEALAQMALSSIRYALKTHVRYIAVMAQEWNLRGGSWARSKGLPGVILPTPEHLVHPIRTTRWFLLKLVITLVFVRFPSILPDLIKRSFSHFGFMLSLGFVESVLNRFGVFESILFSGVLIVFAWKLWRFRQENDAGYQYNGATAILNAIKTHKIPLQRAGMFMLLLATMGCMCVSGPGDNSLPLVFFSGMLSAVAMPLAPRHKNLLSLSITPSPRSAKPARPVLQAAA